MKTYAVKNVSDMMDPKRKNMVITPFVPGSKSITNRALLIAMLAKGKTELSGVLFSDDSRNFLRCVQKLGIETEVDEGKKTVIIHGCDGRIPVKKADIYVGSAGTAARFLTAVLGVSDGEYNMDSSDQMKKRPMKPLLDSLRKLGCEIECTGEEDRFPFKIKGNGFGEGSIDINIDKSSQFLSALLIASVLSDRDFEVDVLGSHGMAYIDMTVRMMEQFGAEVKKRPKGTGGSRKDIRIPGPGDEISASRSFWISGDQSFTGRDYCIEPDVSAAAYFYAMVPLLGITVRVPGVREDSLQGDVEFIRILSEMGCRMDKDENGDIILYPPENGIFHGINADMSACSDQAITLAAIAPYAEGPTTITGIGHIRLQESDRLGAIETELGRLGIKTESGEDWIRIYPGKPVPALVETYEDHRMAMGFSLTGLRADGVVIADPDCCRKTFEGYFDVLNKVIGELCRQKSDDQGTAPEGL